MKAFALVYSIEAGMRIRHIHPAIKQELRLAIDALREDPWAGKVLQKELTGYRALRIRQYRIIYRVDEEIRRIEIATVGIRKTIYEDFTAEKK